MFQQILLGSMTCSFPIIVFFNIFPHLLYNPFVHVISSLFIGALILFFHYKQHVTLEKSLSYAPSGEHKIFFENLIRSCNVDPSTVLLRYAYTGQQIAMAMSYTIIIDPTYFSLSNGDPNAVSVVNIFTQFYALNLNVLQKERQAQQSQLTPAAQAFLVKHELGHILDHYSDKKLLIIFVSSFVAIFVAISAVKFILPLTQTYFSAMVVVFLGILVGAIFDIILTYSSNFFFKVAAEKRADEFAARYSTVEEITDAAHFFEQDQEIVEKYKDQKNLLLKLPTTILFGYLDGKARKNYLLFLAKNNKINF